MGNIRKEVKEQYFSVYPEEEKYLIPFLNGFYVTWGKKRKAYNTEVSEYYLNPEDYIKELFGFEQEILLIYSPYDTMQARTILAIDKIIESEPTKTRVEKFNYILITKANKPEEWISEYQLTHPMERIIISFSVDDLINNKHDSEFVKKKLLEQLYGRDLFDYRLPLKDDLYFFGRQDLLMNFYDAARKSENRGIFGLRKTGKTSFLYKLKRKIENENIGHLYIFDAKSPIIRNLRWFELIRIIKNEILGTKDESIIVAEILENFENAISELPSKIIIAFDEIEYISPFSLTNDHWKKDFIDFWQFMWALQSQYRNFSFVIIGVNPSVVEIDTIDGIQNPLFGLVSPTFFTGLLPEDLKIMVKTLGKKMGLLFEYDTFDYLYSRYGGHPYLTRMAGSWINQNILSKGKQKPFKVTIEYLYECEESRDSDLAFYCRHVVSELNQFYPNEYQMLEMLACGLITDFTELSIFPEYSKHLFDYGLIFKNQNQLPIFAIEAVKRFIGIENARKEGRKTIYKVIPVQERLYWLNQRKKAICQDFRQLEKAIDNSGQIKLFGPNSFPEADKFSDIQLCVNKADFTNFINIMNRCFVESIECYGRSILKSDYFWNDVKKTYRGLWHALNRIKTYRNEEVHLKTTNKHNSTLKEYLEIDLEKQSPGKTDDLYFRLQQTTLDGLFTGIQIEILNYEENNGLRPF